MLRQQAQGDRVAEFSASDAAFSGFRVVAERPWAVGIWAVLQFVASLGLNLFIAVSAGSAFSKMAQLGLQSPATQDPTVVFGLFRQVAPTYLVILAGGLVMNAVLYAAMNRAVLRPQESRFGYLRLGGDELRQLGLFALVAALALGAYLVLAMVAIVLIVVIAVVVGEAVALALGIALLLPLLFCAFIFCAVRLSLASPMTFMTRRIDLRAAWAMTKGRFWPLLGAYALAFALSVVVVILTFAISVAVVGIVGGGMGAVGTTLQSDLSTVAQIISPTTLAYLAISAIGQALIWPVTMTPPATIYRALAGAGATSRVFD
jgi:hypothetical protein